MGTIIKKEIEKTEEELYLESLTEA